MADTDSPTADTERAGLAWLAPQHRASPAEALPRIRAICELCPDLYDATLLLAATHRGVAREHLAAVMKQMRRDLDPLSTADVVSLLTAAWNGGKQGFDAVWRSRQKGDRKAAFGALLGPSSAD